MLVCRRSVHAAGVCVCVCVCVLKESKQMRGERQQWMLGALGCAQERGMECVHTEVEGIREREEREEGRKRERKKERNQEKNA